MIIIIRKGITGYLLSIFISLSLSLTPSQLESACNQKNALIAASLRVFYVWKK